MELKETVDQMLSPDYKERFKAEYAQIKIRIDKLGVFIENINKAQERGEKEPKHDCSLVMLQTQYDRMCMYLDILEKRARIEHVDLSEVQNGKA